jgi:hypothetical protein
VPDSVESLGDIQEGCGAVLLGFICFVDFVHYTVSLVYCRMSLAKAELVNMPLICGLDSADSDNLVYRISCANIAIKPQ